MGCEYWLTAIACLTWPQVHFWIGQESSQDEYGTAAYKTVLCSGEYIRANAKIRLSWMTFSEVDQTVVRGCCSHGVV